MSPESQRIAIAKATGNILIKGQWTDEEVIACGAINDIPHYQTDLNAMHEAEKSMSHSPSFWQPYWQNLRFVVERSRRFHSTMDVDVACAEADQRAEAFLRTLNLWKEN